MDNFLNLINITIAALAVFFAVIAVVQTHKKNKFERLVAETQGVFKKSNIRVCCYGLGASNEESFRIPDIFIIAAKLKPGKTLLFPFITHVVNMGDKTAEEMSLYLRYPKDIHNYKDGKDGLRMTVAPNLDGYKGQYFTEGHFQTVVTEIKKVDPHSGIVIHDLLTINKGSSFDGKVEAKTSDNVPVVVSYSVEFNFVINYTLYQKDCIPLSGGIKIYILDTAKKSISQFVADWNKKANEKWDEKAGKGFLRKFLYLLKLNWRKTSISGNKPVQRIKVITYKELGMNDHPERNTETVKEENIFMHDGFCDITDYMTVVGINFAVDKNINKEGIILKN